MKSIQMKIIFTPILLLLFINFNYAQVKEWANLKKYQAENQSVKPMKNAVVLMGDSITEFWKTNSPDFFANYLMKIIIPSVFVILGVFQAFKFHRKYFR